MTTQHLQTFQSEIHNLIAVLFGLLQLRFSFSEFFGEVEQAGRILNAFGVHFRFGEGFWVDASLDGWRYHLSSKC